MKKVAILLLLQLIVFDISAQHLKFESIPIDGTITSFQSKLSAKGFRVNRNKSKDAPVGQRIFNGKLQGYDSEITVYYARKSKIVYKVEALIESEKEDVIMNILDKTLNKIEKSYIFTTEHDDADRTGPHFRYPIYTNKENRNSIGTIVVNPTYMFNVSEDGTPVELSSYAIVFTYIDGANDDFVPQSEKEPYASPSLTCGESSNFRKFSKWMLDYMQNGCYERSLIYTDFLLDFYRYDCVPYFVKDAAGGDSILDELIKVMQEKCIGSIRTGIGQKWTKVYMVTDNETGYKFIEFDALHYKGLLWNHIKLDENDVRQQIKTLDLLKKTFEEKEKMTISQPSDKNIEERLSVDLPASIGEETGDTYGDIQWNKTNLIAYFSYWERKLSLEITYKNEFEFVFRFRSKEQIESLIQFFKSIEWK